MNKAEYPVVLHVIDTEDGGGYLAVAPDLCGCMGDGATPDEAVACLHEAMDEWEDEMKRLGRPIPAPFALSEKAREEENALRKLVDAQAALIKRHEQSLATQNASLQELRDEVDALKAGVDMTTGYIVEPAVGACRARDKWRDTIMVGSTEKMVPIVRRGLVAH